MSRGRTPTRGRGCGGPPPELGRVRRPWHPLPGILFLYAIAQALLAGAAGDAARLTLAAAALAACLGGAVVLVDGVQVRHLAAKLGFRPPKARAVAVAVAGAAPACVRLALGAVRGEPFAVPALRVVALVLVSGWHEAFCRGHAFGALQRRHGMPASAGIAALLSAGLVWAYLVGSPLSAAARVLIVALDLPLGFGLALLRDQSQSTWPCIVVRAALVVAVAGHGDAWLPAAVATATWLAAALAAQRRAAPAAQQRAGRL